MSITPGDTALARIPRGASSRAIARVQVAMKALLAEYAEEPGLPPVAAEIDTVLTMAAPCASPARLSAGSNARVRRTGACWLSSITRS